MKKFALVALLFVVSLAGCSNDKDKCIKDPTGQDCPRASGNVVSSPPKSWDMSEPTKPADGSPSQSQGK